MVAMRSPSFITTSSEYYDETSSSMYTVVEAERADSSPVHSIEGSAPVPKPKAKAAFRREKTILLDHALRKITDSEEESDSDDDTTSSGVTDITFDDPMQYDRKMAGKLKFVDLDILKPIQSSSKAATPRRTDPNCKKSPLKNREVPPRGFHNPTKDWIAHCGGAKKSVGFKSPLGGLFMSSMHLTSAWTKSVEEMETQDPIPISHSLSHHEKEKVSSEHESYQCLVMSIPETETSDGVLQIVGFRNIPYKGYKKLDAPRINYQTSPGRPSAVKGTISNPLGHPSSCIDLVSKLNKTSGLLVEEQPVIS